VVPLVNPLLWGGGGNKLEKKGVGMREKRCDWGKMVHERVEKISGWGCEDGVKERTE